jgi:hypothetical protein
MTLTVDIKPETEAGLLVMAEARGMSLEQYVGEVIESSVRPQSHMSPEERAAAWIESAKRFPATPLLSDEAISRESIYADRG